MTAMNTRLKIFLVLFYATFLCWLMSVFFCETQQRVFYAAGGDLFADFFNNVRYVATRNPYFDTTIGSHEHIYPPICYLMFYPFACLYNWCGSVRLPEDELFAFWSSPVAMISCTLFMVVSMLPLAWAVWKILGKRYSLSVRFFLFMTFLFSGIFLFSFERGNLVLFTASAVAVFLVCHESRRFLAGGGISLAISMKIYPVFFVALMLRKREYKKVAMVMFSVIALGFLPLLFFKHGMLENSLQLLQNVKAQGTAYYDACPPNLTVSTYVAAAARVWDMRWLSIFSVLLRYCSLMVGIASFIGIWFVGESWKRWFLAATAVVLCTNYSAYYTMLYFVPAIYAYVSSERSFRNVDWLYSIVCVILLTPLQIGLIPVTYDSLNPFISGCLIILVATTILVECLVERRSPMPDMR